MHLTPLRLSSSFFFVMISFHFALSQETCYLDIVLKDIQGPFQGASEELCQAGKVMVTIKIKGSSYKDEATFDPCLKDTKTTQSLQSQPPGVVQELDLWLWLNNDLVDTSSLSLLPGAAWTPYDAKGEIEDVRFTLEVAQRCISGPRGNATTTTTGSATQRASSQDQTNIASLSSSASQQRATPGTPPKNRAKITEVLTQRLKRETDPTEAQTKAFRKTEPKETQTEAYVSNLLTSEGFMLAKESTTQRQNHDDTRDTVTQESVREQNGVAEMSILDDQPQVPKPVNDVADVPSDVVLDSDSDNAEKLNVVIDSPFVVNTFKDGRYPQPSPSAKSDDEAVNSVMVESTTADYIEETTSGDGPSQSVDTDLKKIVDEVLSFARVSTTPATVFATVTPSPSQKSTQSSYNNQVVDGGNKEAPMPRSIRLDMEESQDGNLVVESWQITTSPAFEDVEVFYDDPDVSAASDSTTEAFPENNSSVSTEGLDSTAIVSTDPTSVKASAESSSALPAVGRQLTGTTMTFPSGTSFSGQNVTEPIQSTLSTPTRAPSVQTASTTPSPPPTTVPSSTIIVTTAPVSTTTTTTVTTTPSSTSDVTPGPVLAGVTDTPDETSEAPAINSSESFQQSTLTVDTTATDYESTTTNTDYASSTTDTDYASSTTDTDYASSTTDTDYASSTTDTDYASSTTDTDYASSTTDTDYESTTTESISSRTDSSNPALTVNSHSAQTTRSQTVQRASTTHSPSTQNVQSSPPPGTLLPSFIFTSTRPFGSSGNSSSLAYIPDNSGSSIEDDTFWPIVAALVIGIPSIIVFGIAITVIHKRRLASPARLRAASMYPSL